MYSISTELQNLFQNHSRQVCKVTFTKDGQTLVVTESYIVQGGLTIDRYCVSGEKIEVGSAIAGELKLKIRNIDGRYDDIYFEGASVYVEIGTKDWSNDSATVTYIPCGRFIVDTQPRILSTISLSALDYMSKFDKEVNWSSVSFPITVGGLMAKACEVCGVTLRNNLSNSTLPNVNYSITSAPTDITTWREVLQNLARITGTCAYCDYDGQLEFKWYSDTTFELTPDNRYSSDLYENDIQITGVRYRDVTGTEYTAGEDGYWLEPTYSAMVTHDVQTVVTNIYNQVSQLSYRSYEAVCKPALYMWPLDKIVFTDKNGDDHDSIITNITFTMNGSTAMSARAESAIASAYPKVSGFSAEQQAIINRAATDAANSISIGSRNLILGSQYVNGIIVGSALVGSAIVGQAIVTEV